MSAEMHHPLYINVPNGQQVYGNRYMSTVASRLLQNVPRKSKVLCQLLTANCSLEIIELHQVSFMSTTHQERGGREKKEIFVTVCRGNQNSYNYQKNLLVDPFPKFQ